MHRSFIADCRLSQALEQRSVSMLFQKGQLLFTQGEAPKGLYILKSGKVSLILAAESGVEVMHLTVGPGSILGVPGVVTKQPYTLAAKAPGGFGSRFY